MQNWGKESEKINSIFGAKKWKNSLNISSCFGYCKTMSDLYDRKNVKYDN